MPSSYVQEHFVATLFMDLVRPFRHTVKLKTDECAYRKDHTG